MERFIEGDAGAFDALFRRHAAPVRGFLFRLLGSPAAADDVTQVTFLSVVRARGRFERGARFKPWLYAIAANAARDLHRRRRPEELVAPEELPQASAEASGPEPRDAGLEKLVRAALAQLPEGQREVIAMHRFQELSFAEIGDALGITETAAKVRAHRGYVRLRELLGHLKEGT